MCVLAEWDWRKSAWDIMTDGKGREKTTPVEGFNKRGGTYESMSML